MAYSEVQTRFLNSSLTPEKEKRTGE